MTKEKLISILFVLLAVPMTIFSGMYFLDDRKYYFISILIIFEMLIPFFLSFEKKKPDARELVMVAIMTAVAVAGRYAFWWIPQFQAMTAIIIISGIALGSNTGFLVGAISAFVSNIFIGQGPWTPWQMFAWGTVGFVSGLVIKKTDIKAMPVILAVFGFIITFVLYGLIMNIQATLTMMPEFNLNALIATITLGLPYDLIHAGSTAVFLFIAGKSILDIMNRIKLKHGM